jgi:hypothetical protein
MNFDPSKPYNDLPDLPPSVDIETKTPAGTQLPPPVGGANSSTLMP